jgi:hypothetical protein
MNQPAPPRPQVWLTEHELAKLLKVSVRHLINLRKVGLPHFQLGSVVRYDIVEVIGYLKLNRKLTSERTKFASKAGGEVAR